MQSFNAKNRIVWIDWMKTIGIYFIVLGHYFSIGHKFIYVFNVPLFFIISGFLCKKEENSRLFFKKLLYNLIIPMVIISSIIFLYNWVLLFEANHFTIIEAINVGMISFIRFLKDVLLGYHAGIHECWFVYTLCICKVIYQFCPKKSIFYAFGVVCLLVAYVYNQVSLSHHINIYEEPNSIVNVCVAYPFFAIGVCFRKYREYLDKVRNFIILGVIIICSLLFVYLSAYNNDKVFMYVCGYGRNIPWFLIGGIAGSICIYGISKMFVSAPYIVEHISKGTILILGFHIYIIPLIRSLYKNVVFDFLSAFIIVLLFVPIIIFAEKHLPLLIGKYRLNK